MFQVVHCVLASSSGIKQKVVSAMQYIFCEQQNHIEYKSYRLTVYNAIPETMNAETTLVEYLNSVENSKCNFSRCNLLLSDYQKHEFFTSLYESFSVVVETLTSLVSDRGDGMHQHRTGDIPSFLLQGTSINSYQHCSEQKFFGAVL